MLNQNQEIPTETSRVHSYTREILERDGEPARQVYREFAAYAGNLPLVSYNLEYDLDEVLQPEWRRLRIAPVGGRGFCALRLAQRLLDPVPAGNCKLQTLRQYYRLPERGAHTALGDVQTVADLFANVLRPIAGHRGLDTWEKLAAFAAEEWYSSRIAFGKHKGRLVQGARKDAELRRWLDWLAGSANSRNAKMGRWYLRQLEKDLPADATVFAAAGMGSTGLRPVPPGVAPGGRAETLQTDADVLSAGVHPTVPFGGSPTGTGGSPVPPLVIYVNPELEELRQLVAGARARICTGTLVQRQKPLQKKTKQTKLGIFFVSLVASCSISRHAPLGSARKESTHGGGNFNAETQRCGRFDTNFQAREGWHSCRKLESENSKLRQERNHPNHFVAADVSPLIFERLEPTHVGCYGELSGICRPDGAGDLIWSWVLQRCRAYGAGLAGARARADFPPRRCKGKNIYRRERS